MGINRGIISIPAMERQSRKRLTVPLYAAAVVANVLTSRVGTSGSSLVPSSTIVELGGLVGLSTVGGSSGTAGTSSGLSQGALVGAAEVKMAKNVKKRRTARVRVETERDIVTDSGSAIGAGSLGPKPCGRQAFYNASDNVPLIIFRVAIFANKWLRSIGKILLGYEMVSNVEMSGSEIPFRNMKPAACFALCLFPASFGHPETDANPLGLASVAKSGDRRGHMKT